MPKGIDAARLAAKCLTLFLVLLPAWMQLQSPAMADDQEQVGVWTCLHSRNGSCRPDGIGRGSADFWTYPVYRQDKKVSVNCRLDDSSWSWHEKCVGVVRHPTPSGFWGDGSFGARLTCPAGYLARQGRCVEVAGAATNQNCLLPQGSPIDAATGRTVTAATDWTSTGSNPLQLMRSYASQTSALATPTFSRIGNAWRTNFDASAVFSGSVTSTSLIHIVLPDLREYSFSRKGGVWSPILMRMTSKGLIYWDVPRTGLDMTLTIIGGEINLRLKDGKTYVFNGLGQLARILFADGYTQTLTYEGALNTRVSDSLGRWITFKYGGTTAAGAALPAGLMSEARTSDGALFLYAYEDRVSAGEASPPANTSSTTQWVLKSVTLPDDTPAVATDNPMEVYDYLPSSVRPYLLTGVSDRTGTRIPTWTYDKKGRGTGFEMAGGLNRWQIVYDDAGSKVVVAAEPGPTVTYGYGLGMTGVRELSSVDGSNIQREPNGKEVCFEDCANEIAMCTRLCRAAEYDPDMPNIWFGAFGKCMKGCVSARCGGNKV